MPDYLTYLPSAGSVTIPSPEMSQCKECGALVGDIYTHDTWHDTLNTALTKVVNVAESMNDRLEEAEDLIQSLTKFKNPLE